MKDIVLRAADDARTELLELSHRIHDDPELGMQEHHAVQWQSEVLRHHGFEVQTPYGGLDTAYRATFHGKSTGPHVAFLAEYDALRGVGPVSYTHLRAHETRHDLVCRLLLEKKKKSKHI